jgi:rhodanese-related sulfurtransferase
MSASVMPEMHPAFLDGPMMVGGPLRVRPCYILGMSHGCLSFVGWGRCLGTVLACAGLAGGMVGGCERKTRDTDIKIISLSEMRSLMDRQSEGRAGEIVLVDPRPVHAFEAGHIPGARNIQLPQIDPRGSGDPTLSSYRHIVVYGEDPGSAVARGMTKRLIAVGHRGVRLYAGGMREWRGRGYEVPSVEREDASTE